MYRYPKDSHHYISYKGWPSPIEKNNLIQLFCFEKPFRAEILWRRNKYELELNRLHLSKWRECFSASKIGSFNKPYDFKILCQTPSCFTNRGKSPGDEPCIHRHGKPRTPRSKGHIQIHCMAWHDMRHGNSIQCKTYFNVFYIYYGYSQTYPMWPPNRCFFNSISALPPPPCYRPDTWQPPLFELLAVASVRHKPSKWRGHTALFEWVQVRLGQKPKLPPQKKSLATKEKTQNVVMFFL